MFHRGDLSLFHFSLNELQSSCQEHPGPLREEKGVPGEDFLFKGNAFGISLSPRKFCPGQATLVTSKWLRL
jgi:hypothetical protein